ncbi:hypothetical protein GCM10029976_087430 [Kribbella albertanoniae]|nr:condensation domain-containing protein [Kribbella albertanoniae]
MTSDCRVAGSYPLTFQQYARLERARQAAAHGATARTNLMESACDVTGPLSLESVRSAALAVARRHPALRLSFEDSVQVVAPCSAAEVPVADGTVALSPVEDARLALVISSDGADRHRLTAQLDHLAFDGTSIEIFWRDFWAFYASPPVSQQCACNPTFLAFADAAAARSAQPAPGLDAAVAELRAADSPLGFARFPVRLPLSEVGSRSAAAQVVDLGNTWWASYTAAARANGCTPFVAAAEAVLSAIGDLAPGSRPMMYTYLQNRRTPAEQEAIGWFAATVLLMAPEVIDLRSVRAMVGAALSHGDVATELLHRRCGGGRRPASLPSVSLALSQAPGSGTPLRVGELEIRRIAAESVGSWLPRGRLAVDVAATGQLTIAYEVERYDPAIIRTFADRIADGLLFAVDRC